MTPLHPLVLESQLLTEVLQYKVIADDGMLMLYISTVNTFYVLCLYCTQ